MQTMVVYSIKKVLMKQTGVCRIDVHWEKTNSSQQANYNEYYIYFLFHFLNPIIILTFISQMMCHINYRLELDNTIDANHCYYISCANIREKFSDETIIRFVEL